MKESIKGKFKQFLIDSILGEYYILEELLIFDYNYYMIIYKEYIQYKKMSCMNWGEKTEVKLIQKRILTYFGILMNFRRQIIQYIYIQFKGTINLNLNIKNQCRLFLIHKKTLQSIISFKTFLPFFFYVHFCFHNKNPFILFIINIHQQYNISQIQLDFLTRMKLVTYLFISQIIVFTFALFSSNSAVVKLTDKNFKSLVLESNQLWLVEFYAPWCGHCKKSAPQFEKAAQILQGIINVGAVDVPDNSATGQDYGVSGYPTIKFFGSDKTKPSDFSSSDRTFEKFVNFSLGKAKAQISNRLKTIGDNSDNQQNTDL